MTLLARLVSFPRNEYLTLIKSFRYPNSAFKRYRQFGSHHPVQLRAASGFCRHPVSKRLQWVIMGCGGSLVIGMMLKTSFYSNHVALCQEVLDNSVSDILEVNSEHQAFAWNDFVNLLAPDKWYLLAAVVTALLAAFANIQIPLSLGELVNVLARHSAESVSNFASEMREPALRLIGLYCFQGLLTFGYISLLSGVGERLAARMRKSLFQSVIIQDIAFFDVHKTGEVINRLTTDVQDFKSSFKNCVSQGLRSITQTAGCLISVFLISPKLTGLMIVVVPSIIALGTLLGSYLRRISRETQAQISLATAVANEAIGNVRTVRAFAMEEKELQLYSKEVDYASSLGQTLGVGIGAFQGLSNIALNGLVLATLYVGGHLMSLQEIKAGDLMSFMVATQTMQRSLAQLSVLFGQAVKGLSAGVRVFEYMKQTPLIPMTGGTSIPFHSLLGDIRFSKVGFAYPSRPKKRVLDNFELVIPHGHLVALVGSSGAGKSTIAALLERFYDISQGQITIDGKDLRDLDPSWLRGRAIGYINQEPVLFATTVMENIRYGKPDATDQEVREAATLANAHDFILSFPEGYQTMLGERGVTVSGGQKQRIAIARALIKNPSILILDEATSALDSESERVVQEALDKVTKGRTVLVIAHRLSTIQNADIIAVVDDGKIVEQGQHRDLVRMNGVYARLIKQQSQKSESQSMKQG